MIETNAVTSPLFSLQSPSRSADTSGRNDFMTLLITQLRHQDPLQPLGPQEFASQLASFSTVEELTRINAGLAEQMQSLEFSVALSRTSFSASLLGRSVLVESDQVVVPTEGKGLVTVDAGAGGGSAKLHLIDANGRDVATRDLGQIESGRRTITIPGDLPPGTYRCRIEITGADGQPVTADTYAAGTVDRVLFDADGIHLSVGGLVVDLASLVEIAPAPAKAA